MPGMLYYPFVNASTKAVQQAILYWDFLSTITPTKGETRLSKEMSVLAEFGLYRPISGDDVFDYDGFEELTKLSDRFPLDALIPPSPDSSPAEERILIASKLGRGLSKELVGRGLARPASLEDIRAQRYFQSEYQQLLIVSPLLQLALVGLGARKFARRVNAAGQLSPNSVYPFTDDHATYLNAYHPTDDQETHTRLRVEIGAILPMVREDVPFADLLAFRKHHDNERRRLLVGIHVLLSGMSNMYDNPDDVLEAMRVELETAIADFQSAAKARRVALVSKPLAVLVAMGSAGAGYRFPEIAWTTGVIGGLSISMATQQVRERSWKGEGTGFEYVAGVEAKFSAKGVGRARVRRAWLPRSGRC